MKISKNFKDIEISLALSGGGFRATLFHVGVLRRLVELDLFRNLKLTSSVSGGSIVNALLGLNFDQIDSIEQFDDVITKKIVELVKVNVRNEILKYSVLKILLKLPVLKRLPFSSWKISNSKKLSKIFNSYLFQDKTLADISPNLRCILNSTNLQNGARFRFERTSFGDYKTGYCRGTSFFPISDAVAASATFPLGFTPFEIETQKTSFCLRDQEKKYTVPNSTLPPIIFLSDGGIYDNLGVSPIIHDNERNENTFVIISDASAYFSEASCPYSFKSHLPRSYYIVFQEHLKKTRQAITERLIKGEWCGIFIALENSARHYREYTSNDYSVPTTKDDIPGGIGWDDGVVDRLNKVRTDLNIFSDIERDYLIYHGSSLLDIQLRKWHPELYSQLPDVPIVKPCYPRDEVEKILNQASEGLF